MKRAFRFITLSLLVLVSFFSLVEANAQSTDDLVGFSVQAILPENQRDTGASYYDLLVEPGKSQTLQVEIYNHEDSTLEVKITPTTASTNRNGLIVYEPQDAYDESLGYPISELVGLDNDTVIVPANESTVVNIHLDIPAEPFKGILLGGLHFEKIISEEETNEASLQIQNKYAYVIGLQITEGEPISEQNLNLLGVIPSLVNYRTAVIARLQNDQPMIIGNVEIKAEVYKTGSENVIRTAQMTNAQFAPNSTMDFVIDWENQYLEPGDYLLNLIATNGQNEWEWSEEFSITEEQSELSEEAVELERFTWLTPQLLIGVIVVLIFVILALIIRLTRKDN